MLASVTPSFSRFSESQLNELFTVAVKLGSRGRRGTGIDEDAAIEDLYKVLEYVDREAAKGKDLPVGDELFNFASRLIYRFYVRNFTRRYKSATAAGARRSCSILDDLLADEISADSTPERQDPLAELADQLIRGGLDSRKVWAWIYRPRLKEELDLGWDWNWAHTSWEVEQRLGLKIPETRLRQWKVRDFPSIAKAAAALVEESDSTGWNYKRAGLERGSLQAA